MPECPSYRKVKRYKINNQISLINSNTIQVSSSGDNGTKSPHKETVSHTKSTRKYSCAANSCGTLHEITVALDNQPTLS